MSCPRCKREPCACPPLNLLDVLRVSGPQDKILSSFSMDGLSGLLGASKTTHAITRKHIQVRVTRGRSQLLRLFRDDGPLHDSFVRCNATLPDSISISSKPFDKDKPREALRAGQFLAHVSVAILNTCDRLCYTRFKQTARPWEYGVVVVTTLVVHGVRRILVVALNGGSSRCREVYEKYCTAATFAKVLQIHEVHVVHNSEAPHTGLVKFVEDNVLGHHESTCKEWLKNAKLNEGQDWHGEQKIMKYIKDAFGFDMQKFVLCLGISHLAGPCEDDTTRTQHCGRFLEALRVRDIAFLGVEPGHVMGFWLTGGSKSRKDNPIYKISFKDFES